MIKSGRNVPTPAIPIPDFAVPYAAPIPAAYCQINHSLISYRIVPYIRMSSRSRCRPLCCVSQHDTLPSPAQPLTIPKNGANFGAYSNSSILTAAPSANIGRLFWVCVVLLIKESWIEVRQYNMEAHPDECQVT